MTRSKSDETKSSVRKRGRAYGQTNFQAGLQSGGASSVREAERS